MMSLHPTADEIEREFKSFGSVIPAMQLAEGNRLYCLPRTPGRDRTAYFYRSMAIKFAQGARKRYIEILFPGYIKTYESLAKSYLASYRKLKEATT